jgi:2-dehydro-3-deoxygluconokinase
VRNGLNFTERGYGVRGALGVSDRGNSAASQLALGEFDWDHLFSVNGVRWLHTGGIFAALSETTPDVIEEALAAASRHGTVISYDLNFRPSLWKEAGGLERAREVNRRLARRVDVMIGNEEDFTACLGLHVEGADGNLGELNTASFRSMIEQASTEFPNLKVIATTLRAVRTATVNDWGAIAWSREAGFVEATPRRELEILDRVGGGDSFAAGLIYGLMEIGDLRLATEYGAAHGALAMTTAGDTSTATLAEVEALVRGTGARVQR